jgi:hypothetical protein
MALQFQECPQCHESHAVRANGLMSIHQTAAGERCAPPTPPAATGRRTSERSTGSSTPEDEELAAAFDFVLEERRKPRGRDTDAGLDRRIYAVDGARPVRGGLPTLGKGR